MKAVMRGLYIRGISRRKSKSRELTLALQTRVVETEEIFIKHPVPLSKTEWEEAQTRLKGHMISMADNKRFFLKQKYFAEGESAGHLLSMVVCSQSGPSHVSKMISESGEEVSKSEDVLHVFQEFYQCLYSSRFVGENEALSQYLVQISVPILSDDSRSLLDQPLTVEELEDALRLAPNEKAPGSDGLPAEFYKLHSDTLLPHLLSVFQEAIGTGSLPQSMREAIIVVLLKPDKDPS